MPFHDFSLVYYNKFRLIEPKQLAGWLEVATHPKLVQAALQLADPKLIGGWLATLSSPQSIQAVTAAADPALLSRWLLALTDPRLIDAALGAAGLRIAQPYLDALTQPRVLNAMMLSFEPHFLDATLRATAQALRAGRLAAETVHPNAGKDADGDAAPAPSSAGKGN